MKNSVNRKIAVICAVSAVFICSAMSVFAEPTSTVRPMPGSNTGTVTSSGTSASDETSTNTGDYKASDNSTGVTRAVPTAVPTSNNDKVNIVTDTEKTSKERKGVSVGAMIGWLFLSVIINALISFWIGNRFYRLSKKDSHVTAEIRALRRDVEEKFLQSVGDFTEQATDISNANEDYSANEKGITMQRRQRADISSHDENDEMLRSWENRQQTRQSSSRTQREFEANRRKKYQPTREAIEPEIEGYDEPEDEDSKSGIKSKAKEILGDIFPFRED